jgi:two-component system, chemotaxis family, chemotaxis protein CheY
VKALIVDDSRAMRTIIGQILKGIGFEILEAGNGREGIERLGTCGVPAIAMVDWNMPEMNGLEFIKAVRSKSEFDAMRIMMVTTETEMGRMAEAIQSGANEYVMKPFTKDAILQKLEQMQIRLA